MTVSDIENTSEESFLVPDVSLENKAQVDFILSLCGEDYIDIGSDCRLYENKLSPVEQLQRISAHASVLGVKISDMIKNSVDLHGDEIVFTVPYDHKDRQDLYPLFGAIGGYLYFLEDSLLEFYKNKMIPNRYPSIPDEEKLENLDARFHIGFNETHDRSYFFAYLDAGEVQTVRNIKTDLMDIFIVDDFIFNTTDDNFTMFGKTYDWAVSDSLDIKKALFNEFLKFLHGSSVSPELSFQISLNNTTDVNLLVESSSSEDNRIRAQVAQNPNTPVEILSQLALDSDINVRQIVARSPIATAKILSEMSNDNWRVRVCVAENPNTPVETLTKLKDDKEDSVRICVAKNPNMSVTKEPSLVDSVKIKNAEKRKNSPKGNTAENLNPKGGL